MNNINPTGFGTICCVLMVVSTMSVDAHALEQVDVDSGDPLREVTDLFIKSHAWPIAYSSGWLTSEADLVNITVLAGRPSTENDVYGPPATRLIFSYDPMSDPDRSRCRYRDGDLFGRSFAHGRRRGRYRATERHEPSRYRPAQQSRS